MKKILFLALFLIYGCTQPKKEIKVNPELEYAENLKRRCINDGDSKAYGELIDYYGRNHSEYYELLPISIIMADKYNNDNARISIYFLFIEIANNGRRDEKLFFKLDQAKKEFVLKYLIDGVKNGDSGCKAILEKIEKGREKTILKK